MEMPNIASEINDPVKGITYRVIAYRALSRPELVQCVQQYNAQPARARGKAKPGQIVEIRTIIGHDDR